MDFLIRLERFHENFYDNLETSKRAIQNWKKMRILLLLVKMFGGKKSQTQKRLAIEAEDESKLKSGGLRGYLAKKSISPTNMYKVTWDLAIGFVYLTCFLVDPVVCAFKLEPIHNVQINQLQRVLTFILVFNMMLVPLSAQLRKTDILKFDSEEKIGIGAQMRFQSSLKNLSAKNGGGLDDPVFERDPVVLMKLYIKGLFIPDFLANLPIFFFDMFTGFVNEGVEIERLAEESHVFTLFMGLKLLRFARIKQVTLSLVRVKDILADIFYLHRYLFDNLLSWVLAALKLVLSIHVFACIWVLIASKEGGILEVTGESDEPILVRYVTCWYMMTTTITTVGYGHTTYKGFIDESGHWAGEMIFLMHLQFIGIVLFSSVTREIFSYKHLKTVEEIVQERVDDMEQYLNDISRIRKPRQLPQQIIDLCKKNIQESIENSTAHYF